MIGLFLLFLGAKIGEELARRLGQPAVVGELLGGFVVGPGALALVVPGDTAAVLAEIGVVILLFAVGLEVRLDDLLAVGRPAVLTALVAMILPLGAGVVVGLGIGEEMFTALYIGLALAATSIGITSRVLAELGVLDRTFARVVLGAAVIDDVLALVLIGIVSGAATGDISGSTLLVAVSGFGLIGLGFAAARRARGLRREVFTWPLFAETPLVPAFMLMFAVALIAAAIGLAAIIGAFVAGLIVAETEAREELEHEIRPLGQIFTPFFFAVTGAQLDLSAMLDLPVAGLAIGLALIGVATKAAGGVIGAWSLGRWSSATVGFGMVPRGEVGIVVANLGLAAGLLTAGLFSAVLVAVVLDDHRALPARLVDPASLRRGVGLCRTGAGCSRRRRVPLTRQRRRNRPRRSPASAVAERRRPVRRRMASIWSR
ncbi:MAG: cation:proton antiporter [Chloroflexota bacterium]|nr:cation:proton antiporter [Chloroflexota bacterium]